MAQEVISQACLSVYHVDELYACITRKSPSLTQIDRRGHARHMADFNCFHGRGGAFSIVERADLIADLFSSSGRSLSDVDNGGVLPDDCRRRRHWCERTE